MLRLFTIFLSFILLINCSFDNKTGIWQDVEKAKQSAKIEREKGKLKDIFIEKKLFNEEKKVKVGANVTIDDTFRNKNWLFENYNLTNNVANFSYNNSKVLISKSSRLSKSLNNSNLLFYENNIISNDHTGTIFVYSLNKEKKIINFNFYKKRLKKFNKKIFLAINNGVIYAADNLGYLYSIDISSGKLIWAKNFGVPFRSSIKIFNNELYLANQDNTIYCVSLVDGRTKWNFSTTTTLLKSNFKNDIIVNEKGEIFFINTSGELYSIDSQNRNINWVVNLKDTNSEISNEIFSSVPLVMNKKNIFTITQNSFSKFEKISGARIWGRPISSYLKPILTKNNIFIVTKEELLICLNINDGTVVWSQSINKQLKKINKKILNKIGEMKNLIIAGDQILIFTTKGFLLSFNPTNGVLSYYKYLLKGGFGSYPIFVDGNMYIFGKNKKLHQYE